MKSCCAHSKITHKTIKDLHGNCADKYYCLTCDTEFIIKPTDKITSADMTKASDSLLNDMIKKNKVIFESEDQARKLFSDIGLIETISIAVDEAKKHGYIRKSPVEEAEEILNDFINSRNGSVFTSDYARKILEAIQYLKAENERLKR